MIIPFSKNLTASIIGFLFFNYVLYNKNYINK
jgi:hypothetical protein